MSTKPEGGGGVVSEVRYQHLFPTFPAPTGERVTPREKHTGPDLNTLLVMNDHGPTALTPLA